MSDLETLEKKDAPPVKKASSRKTHWRWQWLIAPLMGISILLHIALLFLPLPALDSSAEETVEEEAPEPDEEAPIDILSLSDIAAPDPPPESPPEPPQPSPESQPPPPTGAVPPPPDPAAPIEETPTEEEFFETELPPEEGFEEPASAFDPGAATNQFIGDISGLGVEDYTSELGLPTPDMLRNPGHAVCFINPASGEVVANVRVASWLDKEPQTLLRENLQDVYGPRGITFNELEPFCGERYFQAFTAEGQPFMTLSLVTLQGSTLLIVWDTPPQ